MVEPIQMGDDEWRIRGSVPADFVNRGRAKVDRFIAAGTFQNHDIGFRNQTNQAIAKRCVARVDKRSAVQLDLEGEAFQFFDVAHHCSGEFQLPCIGFEPIFDIDEK